MADIIGTGWSFPIHVGRAGGVALARQDRDISEAIHMILLTPPGQRVMRPEFGCGIHDLVFAPNDATTWGLAAYHVEQALARWEPRIKVEHVRARPAEADHGLLLVEIRYRIKSTHDRRSLVFPFYRLPQETPAAL